MDADRARIRVAALLAAEAAGVAVLHRLGRGPLAVHWSDLPGWLATAPPADAAIAALRVAGLGIGWWLLATTTLYSLARAARWAGAAGAVGRLTLPALRRLVDRAVVSTVAASALLAGPAAALAGPPVVPPAAESPIPADEGEPVAGPALVVPPVVAAPAGPVGRGPPGRDPARQPAAGASDGRVHEVAPGEHLWAIAAREVAAASGRPAGAVPAHEVAPYWRALVEANRERLRSGDPDLVYPGERVRLPPVADRR